MKLFYTPTSPYARVARIAALECGVEYDGELIDSKLLRTADNPVLEYNCTGRVPTLVDGNTVVTETRSVCRYLEGVGNGTKLFFYMGDWQAERLESIAMSFLDGCALWAREYRRDKAIQSTWLVGVERNRARRTLNWLCSAPGITTADAPWDFAYITLAVAIDYQAYQGLVPDWVEARNVLSAWFEMQRERPSMRATSMPGG